MSVDKKLRNAYYERLYKMRSEIPSSFRTKITDDHLRSLTLSLLDGTVFDIVKELEEIQQLNECSLLNKRMKIISQQNAKMAELVRSHNEELAVNNIRDIKERHDKELTDLQHKLNSQLKVTDQEIILELDQIVSEQQSTLHQAAVPFFKITNNPFEIQIQTHILNFIERLNKDDC